MQLISYIVSLLIEENPFRLYKLLVDRRCSGSTRTLISGTISSDISGPRRDRKYMEAIIEWGPAVRVVDRPFSGHIQFLSHSSLIVRPPERNSAPNYFFADVTAPSNNNTAPIKSNDGTDPI